MILAHDSIESLPVVHLGIRCHAVIAILFQLTDMTLSAEVERGAQRCVPTNQRTVVCGMAVEVVKGGSPGLHLGCCCQFNVRCESVAQPQLANCNYKDTLLRHIRKIGITKTHSFKLNIEYK